MSLFSATDVFNPHSRGGRRDYTERRSKPGSHRLKFKGGEDKKKKPAKPAAAEEGGKTEQDEIAEANALRAKLGLAPLRP